MTTPPSSAPDPKIRCPKDGMAMEKVKVAGVVIDRCHSCGALWFDASELRKVLVERGSITRADRGPDPDAPQGFLLGALRCPRDNAPLAVVPDTAQTHIQVDLCRTCRGVLLDAGELKDLSEFTIRERLRAMWA